MQNDSSNRSTLCVRLYAIRNYFSFMLDILHELSHMSVYRFLSFYRIESPTSTAAFF